MLKHIHPKILICFCINRVANVYNVFSVRKHIQAHSQHIHKRRKNGIFVLFHSSLSSPRTISSLCAANAHKTICFCDDKAKNSFLFVQLVYAEQKLWCCMFAIYTHGKIHRRTVKLNFILVCNMSFVWFQRLMLVLDPYRLHVCMRTGWLLDAPHMYVCVLRTCSSERIIKRRSHSPFSLCSFYFIRSNEQKDRGKLNN